MGAPQAIRYILALYMENGKENGSSRSYRVYLGLSRVNGKESGSSQSYMVYIRGFIGIMEKKMEAPKL